MLAGMLLTAYAFYTLDGHPKMYLPIVAWAACVEYTVGRIWWNDARIAYAKWRTRP
jgi:hypothetical protein